MELLKGKRKVEIYRSKNGSVICDLGAIYTPYIVTFSKPYLYEGELVWNCGHYFVTLRDAMEFLKSKDA